MERDRREKVGRERERREREGKGKGEREMASER